MGHKIFLKVRSATKVTFMGHKIFLTKWNIFKKVFHCFLLSICPLVHFTKITGLTLRLLMSYIYIYIYGAPILDVSRSHTTTHHSLEPTISAGERPQATHLLRLWVWIPPGAWIFVCCECRVLSGRGLCDELITRPEESYRLWCVVVCDLETSRIGALHIYIWL